MIQNLANDEQFEKSQSRTGNPNNKPTEFDKKKEDAARSASTSIEEAVDASDSKNKLKDEGKKERQSSGL